MSALPPIRPTPPTIQRAAALLAAGDGCAAAGRAADAAGHYRTIAQAAPDDPDILMRAGIGLARAGRPADAAGAFGRVVALRPDSAAGRTNLGHALAEAGNPAGAAEQFRAATDLRPGDPGVLAALGRALLAANRPAEAEGPLRDALRLRPGPDAAGWLAQALAARERWAEAEAVCRQALADAPDAAGLVNTRAVALARLGRFDEAEAGFARLLRADPDAAGWLANAANAFRDRGRYGEALLLYRRAVRLRPDAADVLNNLAIALAKLGRADEAVAHYRRALELRPDDPDTHANLAHSLLARGDLAEGWREYEWRWRRPGAGPRYTDFPRWDGAPPAGKTLLLHAEQGLGDTLQFVRYGALVKRLGATVLVDVPDPLRGLVGRCPWVDGVVGGGADPVPAVDAQVPLMSLPGLLGTDAPADIPGAAPYLTPDPALVERWRTELPAGGGLRVGIAWRGNPKFGGDRHRSIRLEQFVPLGWAAGVRLVGLQKGPARAEIAPLADRLPVLDLGGRLGSFDDTAAVVADLDLVVTCDSSVAHLAGALGVPVWVALPSGSDWRWLRGRDDTPWYPTMRLYRQTEPTNWSPVFARMAEDLRTAAAAGKVPAVPAAPAPPAAPPKRATICLATAGGPGDDLPGRLGRVLATTPPDRVEVRLGFDAAPAALTAVVGRLCPGLAPRAGWDADGVDRFALRDPRGSVVRVWDAAARLGPWQLLRRLWHDVPPEGEHVVWVGAGADLPDGWWEALDETLRGRPDYVGRATWADYPPGWADRVRTRPWYRDLPVETRAGRAGVRHMAGELVAVQADRLARSGFPAKDEAWGRGPGWPAALGEVARQHGWSRAEFPKGAPGA